MILKILNIYFIILTLNYIFLTFSTSAAFPSGLITLINKENCKGDNGFLECELLTESPNWIYLDDLPYSYMIQVIFYATNKLKSLQFCEDLYMYEIHINNYEVHTTCEDGAYIYDINFNNQPRYFKVSIQEPNLKCNISIPITIKYWKQINQNKCEFTEISENIRTEFYIGKELTVIPKYKDDNWIITIKPLNKCIGNKCIILSSKDYVKVFIRVNTNINFRRYVPENVIFTGDSLLYLDKIDRKYRIIENIFIKEIDCFTSNNYCSFKTDFVGNGIYEIIVKDCRDLIQLSCEFKISLKKSRGDIFEYNIPINLNLDIRNNLYIKQVRD